MADWSKYQVTTQTAKPTQQSRDLEALAILKAERNKPYNQNERASLEREIQRMSHSAGVAYDLGVPPKTPAIEPTPENLMQSDAALGSGRGAQGGPTAAQAATQTFAPATASQMAPAAAERETQVNPTLKGLAYGAAKGVTAGTFDYLPAGMAYAYSRVRDRLGSGRPDNYTFKELLAAQRGQSRDIAAAAPVAYTLGDVGGSVALGYATGGASLPATMASQGAQSAVRKYTESEDTNLADAAQAGAVGAGVAGVLKGAGDAVVRGATKLKDSVLSKAMESRNVNIARDNAKIAAANTQAIAKQAEKQAAADAAYLKNLPDSGPIPPKPMVPAAAIVAEKPLLTEATYAAQQGAQPISQLAGKRVRQVAKNAALTLTPSALAGSGAYYIASENPQWGIDPTMAGMVAGGAPLARKSIRDMVPQTMSQAKAVAGLAINKYPNVLPNATRAGVAAGGAVTGQAQGLPVSQETQDPVVSKWGKYAE